MGNQILWVHVPAKGTLAADGVPKLIDLQQRQASLREKVLGGLKRAVA